MVEEGKTTEMRVSDRIRLQRKRSEAMKRSSNHFGDVVITCRMTSDYIRKFDNAIDRSLYTIGALPIKLDASTEAAMARARTAAHGRRSSRFKPSTIVFPPSKAPSIFNSHIISVPQLPPPSPLRRHASTGAAALSPLRRRSDAPLPAGSNAAWTPAFAQASHLHPSPGGLCGSPPVIAPSATGRRKSLQPPNLSDHIVSTYFGLCPGVPELPSVVVPAKTEEKEAAQHKPTTFFRDVAIQAAELPPKPQSQSQSQAAAVPRTFSRDAAAQVSHIHPSLGGMCGSPLPIIAPSATGRRAPHRQPPLNLIDHIVPTYVGLHPGFPDLPKSTAMMEAEAAVLALARRKQPPHSIYHEAAIQAELPLQSLSRARDAAVQAVPSSTSKDVQS